MLIISSDNACSISIGGLTEEDIYVDLDDSTYSIDEDAVADDRDTYYAEEFLVDRMRSKFGEDVNSHINNESYESENEDLTLVEEDEECSIESCSTDKLFLCFESSLKTLLKLKIPDRCCKCLEEVNTNLSYIGTALSIKWVCKKHHLIEKWYSQPVVNRMNAGDLLMSSSIVMSGNNYWKINLLAKFLNLAMCSSSSFFRIQNHYVNPTIKSFWNEIQMQNIERAKLKKSVVLKGDGRMDSPGFSAKYCAYTFMEHESNDILVMIFIDKRLTSLKSSNMEVLGFQRGMDYLISNGVHISEVVTDAHSSITKLMKTKYKKIDHSYDVWHVAKNLGKKMFKASSIADSAALAEWIPDIITQFWYLCEHCRTANEFKSQLSGILHHVQGRHEWILGQGAGQARCMHGELNEEANVKSFIVYGSPAYTKLANILISDGLLMKYAPYLINFRHTGELESFHNLILKYIPKRFAFGYQSMKCRTMMAGIDQTVHLGRELRVSKDGKNYEHRKFNKKSGKWTKHSVKKDKTYPYIEELKRKVYERRVFSSGKVTDRLDWSPSDPRRLSTTITKIPPPPTKDIPHVTRFNREEK